MNNIDKLKLRFQELRARSLQENAKIYGTGLWESWHELADAQYEPAKEFFIERLDDARSAWRTESISLLGFHYKLDDQVLEKIRALLLHDTDSGVRIVAASVLGSQGRYPEKALLHALDHDSNNLVREFAFSALLELATVPYLVKRKELRRVKSEETSASLEQVKRVLLEQNLFSQAALLDEAGG